jgi:hypothetical protein
MLYGGDVTTSATDPVSTSANRSKQSPTMIFTRSPSHRSRQLTAHAAGISHPMTPYLTKVEITKLDQLFLVAFHAVNEVRRRAPVGRALHAVKVPPRLSEGMVAAYCAEIFGPATCVLERRAPHDVTLRARRRLNVAVKGSGLTDWAVITSADRLADVLAWVDYRDRLLDSEAPVLVWRIPIAALPPNANRVFLRALCAGVMPVAINPSG